MGAYDWNTYPGRRSEDGATFDPLVVDGSLPDSAPDEVELQRRAERAKQMRDRLKDPVGALRRDLGEGLTRYRQSGRIGKFIMKLREPETVRDIHHYDEIIRNIESVGAAQRSAYANEGNIVIF